MSDTGPISPIPPVPGQHNSKPRKKDRTLLWTILLVSAMLVAILAVAAIHDRHGDPWISDSIIGQAIATLGIIGAAVGPSLVKVARDTATIKHEVKNDHHTNYRVEQDVRFDRIIRYFER